MMEADAVYSSLQKCFKPPRNALTKYIETRGQPATIIPRFVCMLEMLQGASFPELSHYILQ